MPTVRRPAISWAGVALVGGWFTYEAVRLWLTAQYALPANSGELGLKVRHGLALGFITSIESYWVLVLPALVLLVKYREWVLAVAIVGAFSPAPVASGSFLVHDITRSLAYGFPLALWALVVLARYLTRDSLRHLALVVAAFAMLIPDYYYHFSIQYITQGQSSKNRAFFDASPLSEQASMCLATCQANTNTAAILSLSKLLRTSAASASSNPYKLLILIFTTTSAGSLLTKLI